jgi:sacsin
MATIDADIVVEGEAFGQSEALTSRLRTILEEYPDGSQIKELIQNADDAGATEVRFVLDWRNHKDESLLCKALQQFQGPALMAWNNALFQPEDFSGIQRIGKSRKRHDLSKTGKVCLKPCYYKISFPRNVGK